MENLKFNKEQYDRSNPMDLVECECFECNSKFLKQKRHISYSLTKSKWNECRYCSLECYYKSKSKDKWTIIECGECGKKINRRKKQVKSGNSFCSKSCSVSFNNKNKKFGVRNMDRRRIKKRI